MEIDEVFIPHQSSSTNIECHRCGNKFSSECVIKFGDDDDDYCAVFCKKCYEDINE